MGDIMTDGGGSGPLPGLGDLVRNTRTGETGTFLGTDPDDGVGVLQSSGVTHYWRRGEVKVLESRRVLSKCPRREPLSIDEELERA